MQVVYMNTKTGIQEAASLAITALRWNSDALSLHFVLRSFKQ